MPLPEPEAPLEIVTQAALLTAVQAQPEPVVTLTLLVLAVDPTDAAVGEILTAHGFVNANWFDGLLRPTPPGPTATTLAS